MDQDAVQALEASWLHTFGSDAGWDRLVAAYSEPHRHYHTLDHLAYCFGTMDRVFGPHVPPAVVMALWFHDYVYDARARDNETKSAEVARRHVPGALGNEVAALILATAHDVGKKGAIDRKTCMVLDLDLAILSAPTDIFDKYDRDIHREYDWVADPDYRIGRAGVLHRFLDRPCIYLTAEMSGRDERARSNIGRALERLGDPFGGAS
jgi:predicted metal-dependent HD superfamily phosphohydrolase